VTVSLTKTSQNHLRERVGLKRLLKNCETIHEKELTGRVVSCDFVDRLFARGAFLLLI
jgi:hypothetical protein